MEKYNWIKLIFDADLVIGESISFTYGDGTTNTKVKEEWSSVRYGSGIVGINTPTANAGESSARSFRDAFNLDFNVTDLFIVEVDVNEVIIYATAFSLDFDNIEVPSNVTASRDNNSGTAPFEILSVTMSAGSTCDKITVSVLTSELADEMVSPFPISPVTNPIVFDYDRMLSFDLQVKKGNQNANQFVSTPAVLYPSGINLEINDSPGGSSVKINAGGWMLNFKYSLNGNTYQNSNVFTGLIGGQYTAYVKDQFGCVTEKGFELDSFGINTPYFYLPTANSIRFANRVPWGDCGNYKNDFNTLSCEVDVPLPKMEIQQFQTCDKIITQFKSNYKNNVATLRKISDGPTGISYLPPIIKKTDNLRNKDKRDAIITDLGNGKIGVFFEAGNKYNYDTNAIDGSYTLNGSLPIWGKSGNYIQLENGNWYLIEDVIYSDLLGAEVLVVDIGLFPPFFDYAQIVASFYNLQNYEVYEFEIDFFTYINEKVQVAINANDPYFDSIRFKSEVIDIKVRQKRTLEIKYWSDDNTDVFYATGIINKMRMPLEKSYGQPSGSIDSYDTDTDTILLNADIRQLDVFVFEPMTKAFMWKIDEALSHKYVTLDGVRYGEKSIEVSEVLGETNLYDVTATMKKANVAFRSKGMQFDDSAVEIPALIPTGTGYVKYQ